mmetsp:Transcript_17251/g.40843  ORF Transcript_17251/g.40843 Transcript_17251/m.40843 type:complete len:267 (-) Transcript_17251:241-1041(-)
MKQGLRVGKLRLPGHAAASLIAKQALAVGRQHHGFARRPCVDLGRNVPEVVVDVGPKCALPGEGKPRGIPVQENRGECRVGFVGQAKVSAGRHGTSRTTHVKQAPLPNPLGDELAELGGKLLQHKAIHVRVPTIGKDDAGLFDELLEGPKARGARNDCHGNIRVKVPRLQVEQGLCLLFAGTHTEDGNVGEGTWIKAHFAKSIGACVVVRPAAVQTSEPSRPRPHIFRIEVQASRSNLLVVHRPGILEAGDLIVPKALLQEGGVLQ